MARPTMSRGEHAKHINMQSTIESVDLTDKGKAELEDGQMFANGMLESTITAFFPLMGLLEGLERSV